jgi:serine/threonine protein kinase
MAARLADRYRLLHPVWTDSFGVTHIAAAPDGTPAAVRVLASVNPAVFHRATTDRDLLTSIHHPNVAAVRAVLVENRVSIATDAVLGRTLRRARMDSDELTHVATGIAAALAELHAHGLCHRTLSPSTVVVGRKGEVVLTDVAVGHLLDLPGSAAQDHEALAGLVAAVWRNTHGRLRRPPRLLRDVWADTMARARDMG